MYLNHFGLAEAPYRITPHTDFFFEGANRGATLEALMYAVMHDEGIVKVTGEVGSGKTMLCRVLMERLPPNVETIYIANPSLSRDEILLALLDDLKVPSAGQRTSLILRALQEHLVALYAAGRKVVVLIDEAHAMPVETLEEVRLLSNLESKRHKLLQIVLFGQQELDDILGRAQMRQLRERIVHGFRLEPLVRSDVGNYLMFRMRQAGYRGPDIFSADAVKRIAEVSEGLTRRVNILADKSLLAAFSEGEHQITVKHVEAAARDSEFASLRRPPAWLPSPRHLATGAGLMAFGALVAVGAMHFVGPRPPVAESAGTIQPAPARIAEAVPAVPPSPADKARSKGDAAQEPAPANPPAPAVVAPTPMPAKAAPPKPSPEQVAAAPAANRVPDASRDPPPAKAPAPAAATKLQDSGVPTKPGATTAKPAPTAREPDKLVLTKTGSETAGAATPAAAAAPAAGTNALEPRLAASREWLAASPPQTFTLQLLVADAARANEVEAWIAATEADLPNAKLFVYNTSIRGQARLGVLFGSFASRGDAQAALEALPRKLRDAKPIIRTVGGLRGETPR